MSYLSYSCAYPIDSGNDLVIPRSSLGYSANTVYPGFPPLMSDGRAIIASDQPEAVLNNALLKEAGIQSNWEYRKYLTHQAKDIMRFNYRESANDVGYFKRYEDTPAGYSVPFTYPSFISQDKPNGYISSDLKSTYLSREQLQSQKVAPVITQAELMNFGK
jgi:hypothetical protein